MRGPAVHGVKRTVRLAELCISALGSCREAGPACNRHQESCTVLTNAAGCFMIFETWLVGFDADLAEAIRSRLSGAVALTAAGSLVAAIRALGVDRVAFASPYTGDINDRAVAFLRTCGIETVRCADARVLTGGLDLDSHGQGALTPHQVVELAVSSSYNSPRENKKTCCGLFRFLRTTFPSIPLALLCVPMRRPSWGRGYSTCGDANRIDANATQHNTSLPCNTPHPLLLFLHLFFF